MPPNTNDEPKRRMRRGELYDWLTEMGYSRYEVDCLIGQKVIKPSRIRPNGRAYYDREQIRQAVLESP